MLLSHTWSAFCRLNSSRTAGFSGPNPITYQEMACWMSLTEESLTPFEVDLIKSLDQVYMKVTNGC